jgi:hypothetical protein
LVQGLNDRQVQMMSGLRDPKAEQGEGGSQAIADISDFGG